MQCIPSELYRGGTGLTVIGVKGRVLRVNRESFCNYASLRRISFPISLRCVKGATFTGANLGSLFVPSAIGSLKACTFSRGRTLK